MKLFNVYKRFEKLERLTTWPADMPLGNILGTLKSAIADLKAVLDLTERPTFVADLKVGDFFIYHNTTTEKFVMVVTQDIGSHWARKCYYNTSSKKSIENFSLNQVALSEGVQVNKISQEEATILLKFGNF